MPVAPLFLPGLVALLSAIARKYAGLAGFVATPSIPVAPALIAICLLSGLALLRRPHSSIATAAISSCALLAPWVLPLAPAPLQNPAKTSLSAVIELIEPAGCSSFGCSARGRITNTKTGPLTVLIRGPISMQDSPAGARFLVQGILLPFDGGTVPGASSTSTITDARLRGARAIFRVRNSDHLVRIPDKTSSISDLSASAAPGKLASPGLIESLRSKIRNTIKGAAPEDLRPLFAALLIGEKRDLEAHTRALFADTGTAHLLAISGLHVGMLSALAALLVAPLLRRLRRPHLCWDPGRLALPLGLLGGCCYALIAGAPLSARRAVLFLLLATAARALDRPFPIFNALGAASLGAACFSPTAAASLSFLLSYSAVLGIAIALPPEPPRFEARLLKRLKRSTLAAIGATIGTAPAICAVFGNLPTASVPANLLITPLLATLCLPLLLITTAISLLLPTWAEALLTLPSYPAHLCLDLLEGIHSMPAARPISLRPDPFELLCWSVALLALIIGIAPPTLPERLRIFEVRLTAALAIPLLLLAPPVLHKLTPPSSDLPPANTLALTVLDVGHGNALLLHLPDGAVWLVDGGVDRAGMRLVLPALQRMGVRRLDAVVATHGDSDHAGGLIPVLSKIKVERLYLPAATGDPTQPDQSDRLPELLAIAKSKGIPVEALDRSDGLLRSGQGWELKVLAPIQGVGADENARSVVLHASYGQRSILLTGDIDKEVERALLRKHPELQADVLELSHHGSKTGTDPELLAKLKVRLALGATGIKGRVSWPHPTTQEELNDAGIDLMHTARDGSLQTWTEGNELWIRNYQDNHWSKAWNTL